jgi:hypothetical protein
VTLDTLKMTATGLGISFVVAGANGRVTVTANGQPVTTANLPLGDMGLSQLMGRPVMLRMTPAGQITEAQGLPQTNGPNLPGMNVQHLFTGGIILPERAVAPGESWSTKTATPAPMPNGQTAQLETSVTSTLKSLAAQGKHQVATIDTTGTIAMAGQRGFSETFTSTTRFDATAGATLGSDLRMQVMMDLGAQVAGAPNPPAGGFAASTMTGTIHITTGPVPTAPAPKKAPTRTRRRR